MKSFVCLSICLLGFVAIAGPAAAATANFQANCDHGIPTDCIFDPTRTPTGGTPTACPGSSVKKYFWDFGDGTSAFVTPPPHTTSHTYSTGVQTDVCLTVFCNDGTSSPAGCHCFSNQVGVNGCIRNIANWTP